MRLLSPKEIRISLRQEEDRLNVRTREVVSVIQAEEKKLNDLRGRYAAAEVELQKNFERRRMAYEEAESQIVRELHALEEKCRSLAYSTDEARMKEREKSVSIREMDLASKEAFYLAWKTELSEKEDSLQTKERSLLKLEKSLKERSELLDSKNNNLLELDAMVETMQKKAKERMDVVECKEKILQNEQNKFALKQSSEEKVLRELEKSLEREHHEIVQQRKALKDGYATLERSKNRIKKYGKR